MTTSNNGPDGVNSPSRDTQRSAVDLTLDGEILQQADNYIS